MVNPNGRNPYPGYPQSGSAQPMGMPQAAPPGGGYPGGNPYPGPAAPPPSESAAGRRGGSARTLPIIAGVGMAVGVFGGLMIIFGTGSSKAADDKPVAVAKQDAGAQANTQAATPDAGAVAAAQTPDAAPAEPKAHDVVLKFDVEPADASIQVNGKGLDEDSFTVSVAKGEQKKVEIKASADGYQDWSKTITVTDKDDEERVEIALKKKRTSSSGSSASSGSSGKGTGSKGTGSKGTSTGSKGTGSKGTGKGTGKGSGKGGSGGLIDL